MLGCIIGVLSLAPFKEAFWGKAVLGLYWGMLLRGTAIGCDPRPCETKGPQWRPQKREQNMVGRQGRYIVLSYSYSSLGVPYLQSPIYSFNRRGLSRVQGQSLRGYMHQGDDYGLVRAILFIKGMI